MVQMLGWFRAEAACASPLEAGQGLRVLGDVMGQKLQGNETVQGDVLGLVHQAHPASAEFLHDAVVRDGPINRRRLARCATILGGQTAVSQCIGVLAVRVAEIKSDGILISAS
jgi:hypothetical protein